MTDHPSVCLVVPIRNEERFIDRCLASLVSQNYPHDKLQILVVDGESADGTREVVLGWARRDARIRLLHNPRRTMPHGLNIGIGASTSDFVGVISGHSVVATDYVSRVIEAFTTHDPWSVGGAIVRIADNEWQRAISAANGSRIGVGDSRHNYATTAQHVEAVFPGMWRRSLFDAVGLFDPEMIANEDNEFSYRIRKAGGTIWFDPSIEIQYFPRGDLRQLFRQYRGYGFGKVRVLRKHRGGLRWRHFVPAAWVSFLVAGGVVAVVIPAWRSAWLGGLALYGLVVGAESVRIAPPGVSPLRTFAALATMHAAYGAGFWQGVLEPLKR